MATAGASKIMLGYCVKLHTEFSSVSQVLNFKLFSIGSIGSLKHKEETRGLAH